MVPVGTFSFVMLILRDLPKEIRKLLKIYVAQVVITNACVVFGGLLQFFSCASHTLRGAT